MVFFEAIQALFALDFGFFVDVVMNNLIWVFGFYVFIYIFFKGKNTLVFFLIFGVYLWAFLEFSVLTGLYLGALGFFYWFILRVILSIFVEEDSRLTKYTTWAYIVGGFGLLWVLAFIVR
ncbi:MAG TPA: hypothetical protein VJG83_04170 [archaeon]|nr:hypothetical protein [archaeon]